MANIKLDKNVIVSFPFADESRLLVVLQFSFFSCEKRTLLLMLNFLFELLFKSWPIYSALYNLQSIAVPKKRNKKTISTHVSHLRTLAVLFDSLPASLLLISKSQ